MNRTLLFFLFALPAFGAFANGYTYKRVLTQDHTLVVTNDQTNFPIYFTYTDATLKTVANSGHVQNTVTSTVPYSHTIPADLIITDTDCSTVLKFEIEFYSATVGTVTGYFKKGTLSHTVNALFCMYYGNASVTTDQSDPHNVWDANFVSTWHFPDGTTLALGDSTVTAATGTNHGATAAAGQLDGGLATASSTWATAPMDLRFIGQHLTIEAWFFKASYANNDALLMEFTANGASLAGGFTLDPNSASTKFEVFANTAGGGPQTADVTFTRPSAGAWHSIAVILDFSVLGPGSQIPTVYIDGVSQSLTVVATAATTSTFANATLNFMCRNGASLFTAGSLDEVRISSVARPVDWLQTTYNNESGPAAFLALGGEQVSASGPQIRSTRWR